MKRLTMGEQRAILKFEPSGLESGLRAFRVFIVSLVFASGFWLVAAGAQTAEADGGASSESCLRCHAEKLKGYEHSAHSEAKIGCVKCHPFEDEGAKTGNQGRISQRKRVKSPDAKLCYGCHGEVEPEFGKAIHHPLGECEKSANGSKVLCSDCHELHQAVEKKGVKKAAVEAQSCLKCHKELAGPFEFEHAALKGDGCTICHVAHGGENPKLLRRASVNALCTECHSPQVNIKGRVIQGHILNAQSAACTSCHIEIHGSATSEFFFNAAQ
jgi:DmsE family decaheme c-type cytochrome